jgi:hypothetical protein
VRDEVEGSGPLAVSEAAQQGAAIWLGEPGQMVVEVLSLVVWKLDRLGRSVRDLLDLAGGLNDRGVGFVSLTGAIDTATVSGLPHRPVNHL